jgi:hypothetical protein
LLVTIWRLLEKLPRYVGIQTSDSLGGTTGPESFRGELSVPEPPSPPDAASGACPESAPLDPLLLVELPVDPPPEPLEDPLPEELPVQLS